ncbi:hypothetical protein LCGC14_2527920 [marine sediment metagenome]|uniref:Uncharacterized protein n=1 Tax=marine sediment metagenome TaxID=412755 RepID=A0A0F9D636_9ZZZZ
MIKVGDTVKILESNASPLKVGSQHVVTGLVKDRARRILQIGPFLFPTSMVRLIKEKEA